MEVQVCIVAFLLSNSHFLWLFYKNELYWYYHVYVFFDETFLLMIILLLNFSLQI